MKVIWKLISEIVWIRNDTREKSENNNKKTSFSLFDPPQQLSLPCHETFTQSNRFSFIFLLYHDSLGLTALLSCPCLFQLFSSLVSRLSTLHFFPSSFPLSSNCLSIYLFIPISPHHHLPWNGLLSLLHSPFLISSAEDRPQELDIHIEYILIAARRETVGEFQECLHPFKLFENKINKYISKSNVKVQLVLWLMTQKQTCTVFLICDGESYLSIF